MTQDVSQLLAAPHQLVEDDVELAVLVVVEVIILGAGVMARYVFHAPLVWSDELASILFLWLSMLGAVVALRRGEHMRMTGLVSRVSPQTRALLEAVAITASIAFLLPPRPRPGSAASPAISTAASADWSRRPRRCWCWSRSSSSAPA